MATFARSKQAILLALVALLALSCVFSEVHAQHRRAKSREELEAERRRLEREVSLTSNLIRDTRRGREQSLAELRLLNRQIDLQEKLLETIGQEVVEIDTEMVELNGLIVAMQRDKRQMQENYSKVALAQYKTQHELSALLWLLSSDSFTEAYNRLMYFREYSRFRTDQIRLLQRTETFLTLRRNELDERRRQKAQLLNQRRTQSQILAENKRKQNELYRTLGQRQAQYEQQLAQKRRALDHIKSEISAVVAEAARSNNASASTNRATIRLTGLFERNKGKLPWPVSVVKGVVTGNFGRQQDVSGGVVQNDGIYITAAAGQKVRAVYSGVVSRVINIPGVGNTVMIRHGNYITVYVNLKEVFVKQGQQVRTMEDIGTINANAQTGAPELQFLIYNGRQAENPMRWIVPKTS